MAAREARTIGRVATLTGVGLHTGRQTLLRLLPELSSGGIRFVRTDLPGRPSAGVSDVDLDAAPFRTVLKNGAAEVHTVEHILSALSGLGISDCVIELDGLEVPGMDGSALPFAEAIREAGIVAVKGKQIAPLAVKQPVVIEDKGARIEARPNPGGLRISYHLDYPGHPLAQGNLEVEITEAVYLKEIAPARTFAIKKDAEAMRASGLGKGANLQNTVVIDGGRALETELRFKDEPVRHKILDLIGDLYILGRPVEAHIIARCSGHRANRLLALRLLEEEKKD